jgi:hypothetical protein
MEYTYHPTNWLTVLKEFASLIGTSVSDEGRLEIPPQIANGFVRASSCGADFHFILINGKMNESFTFNRMMATNPRSYLLIYIEVFAPQKLSITDTDNKVYDGLEKMHTILFTSTDHPRSVTFSSGTIVKLVGLQLSESWINNQLNESARKLVERAAADPINVQLNHVMQNDVSRLVNEIFELEQFHPAFKNTQENRMFMLCENFFKSFGE